MRRVTLVSIALVVLVFGAGCQALGSDAERTDRAESALADAQTALEDIRTYSFETTMHVQATVEGRSVERDVGVTGAVNASQTRLRSTATMEDESATSYVDNRTAYEACGGMGESWGNETITVEDAWIETTPAGRQLGLLAEGDLHVAEDDTEAAPGTIVLVGNPSPSTFEESRDENPQPVFGGTSISNVSVRMVIDEETHRPLRSTISFEISGNSGTGSATIETRFSNFDEPVDIDIPSEVQEHLWETGCPR